MNIYADRQETGDWRAGFPTRRALDAGRGKGLGTRAMTSTYPRCRRFAAWELSLKSVVGTGRESQYCSRLRGA